MSKKIMVTGAAGLIGSAVVEKLAERGDAVVALDRSAAKLPGAVPIQACDIGDVHGLYRLAGSSLDGVVHCGAHSGPMVARDQPASMVQVNIMGTANMLELARVLKARRFVYCSSASAYGSTPEGSVDEETPLRPTSLYGASKAASEYLVTAYADQYGLDGVSLRLSWVYGPRRTTDCFIRTLIEDALEARPTRVSFGEDFPRHYVHVDDAARALILALDTEQAPRRAYNITGGPSTTLGEVARAVREVLPSADIVLQRGQDPLDDVQHHFDIRAAKSELGYAPSISLPQGIRSYTDWLQSTRASRQEAANAIR